MVGRRLRALAALGIGWLAGGVGEAAAQPVSPPPLPAPWLATPERLRELNLPEPAHAKRRSLILVGDSTVRTGRGDGGNGQWGWGDRLGPYFDLARVNLVNRAVGGLSSRTYVTYGYWERTLALAKRGDVMLLQFGHNDSSPVNDDSRARGTLPGLGPEIQEIDNRITGKREVVHTYGHYLRRLVAEARARRVQPIVCSPVPRKSWEGGRVVRNTADYAGWAREVARVERVPVLDLNECIARRYEALGPAAVEPLFADERTHTSSDGAALNAECVVAALKGLPRNPLAKSFSSKAAAVAPWRP
jgi:rhamnogalacturonan acetylesterase